MALIEDDITVFPTSVKRIQVRYYKQPEGISSTTGARTVSLPTFGFTVSNGKEAYNASTSVDFELPDHYTSELVFEIAKLIGINMRDANVYNYGNTESQK